MNNGTAGKNITAKYNLPFSLAVPITSLKNGATVTKIELNAEKVTAIINFGLLKGLRWNRVLELLASNTFHNCPNANVKKATVWASSTCMPLLAAKIKAAKTTAPIVIPRTIILFNIPSAKIDLCVSRGGSFIIFDSGTSYPRAKDGKASLIMFTHKTISAVNVGVLLLTFPISRVMKTSLTSVTKLPRH